MTALLLALSLTLAQISGISARVADDTATVEVYVDYHPDNTQLFVYVDNGSYFTHNVGHLAGMPKSERAIFKFDFRRLPKGTYTAVAFLYREDKDGNPSETYDASTSFTIR